VADALVNGKALRISDGASPQRLSLDPSKRTSRAGWHGGGRGGGPGHKR
jgi:hypothetical protein